MCDATITVSRENSKIGKIPNFSLPAGETCPGRTKACASVCYAEKYCKVFTSADRAYAKNLDKVLTQDGWQMPIIKLLARTSPKYFRIHVSGDMFSPKYIQEWGNIIRMFPQTRFLAFTRSWRLARLRKELDKLRQLPNAQIIASCDMEAHNAPDSWRRAYMGKPETGSAILCPGYGKGELTCDNCGICFKPLKANVYFPIH